MRLYMIQIAYYFYYLSYFNLWLINQISLQITVNNI